MTTPPLSPHALAPDATAKPPSKKPPRTRLIALIIAAVVLIGALIVASVLLAPEAASPQPAAEKSITQATTQPDDTADTDSLRITNQFTGRDPAGSGDWWYMVMFENDDASNVYVEAPIVVNAVDANGDVLDEHTQPMTFTPGPNVAVGTFAGIGSNDVGNLEVSIASEATVTAVNFEAPRLTLAGVSSVLDVAAGAAVVRGKVTNTSSAPVQNAEVIILAADPNGDALGYVAVPIPMIAPGEETTFEANFPGGIPAGTTFHPVAQE